MKSISFALFLAVAFIAFPSFGDWEALSADEFEMAAPPRANSAAAKADFEKLHYYQETREAEQCELAASQVAPTFQNFFGPASEQLTSREFSKVKTLMERVFKVGERISKHFKHEFRRPRPFNVDTTLTPCVQKPGGATAYPSSHAVLAALGGCVLAEIYPTKAVELKKHGSYLGTLRAVVGVHHPTDVEAGKKLAADICSHLLSEADFVEELPNR